MDFILRLSNSIPEEYSVKIVGNLLNIKKLSEKKNIINIDKVPTKILNDFYQSSMITLVPSFYTEAFGRVIIESLLNDVKYLTIEHDNKFYVTSYIKIDDLWLEIMGHGGMAD